ncbi:hypothetical protein LOD99_13137 [Oopsacas minuta]|uniref:Uncharacterized protein n=1 Tax=Oopsacas minuta TaxID=111878 RepID=A0AAV7JB12_9METZ|nr:hypothetical protein LOD99_13137 [Oopsacas minuta]
MFKTETASSSQDGEVIIRELQIVDQLNDAFTNSIKEFRTASMICGYLSCCIAELVSAHFSSLRMQTRDVEKMVKILSHPAGVLEEVREMMSWLLNNRQKYVLNHKTNFPVELINSGTIYDEERYLRDWVANYEISDWLHKKKNGKIHFVRRLERDLGEVYHEEKDRLNEEEPFLHLNMFYDVTLNTGERLHLTPSQWLERFGESLDSDVPAFIADVGGHFVVLKPIILIDKEGKESPLILILNTFKPDYTKVVTVTGTFNMLFRQLTELTDPKIFVFPGKKAN